MKKTAKFCDAKHEIALGYDRKLIGIRYVPAAEHVKRFYMRKRSEFSQMQHVVGTECSTDPIMSDA